MLNNIKLIIILAIIVYFVVLMMKKKISTIIALPTMGFVVAIVAAFGSMKDFGLFDTVVSGKVQMGILNGVINNGVIMMGSAIAAAIFGAAFATVLKKVGLAEKIIKTCAELAGDRPMVIAIAFYIATVIIFAAIGGLGAVILIGSVALPIMMTAGIKEEISASIVLLGLTTGGMLNAANYATFAAVLAPTMNGDIGKATATIVNIALPIFAVSFVISILFIMWHVGRKGFFKAWAVQNPALKEKKQPKDRLGILAMISPIIPVLIIIVGQIGFKVNIPVEVAIVIGIFYLLCIIKAERKLHILSASFIEGTQSVAGAIVLLIGLGILIKGFQFSAVTPIIQPLILVLVSALHTPLTYIIGFTIATPLVLYRGPLNTFGIGGALPVIFAAAGFSPIAIIWVLYSVGLTQGFADPTNSQNIWISDFVQVSPQDITKRVLLWGIFMTLVVLCYAIFIAKISLVG